LLEPLVIHNHIPKTGGNAMRQLLKANYGPRELIHVSRPPEVQGETLLEPADLVARTTAWRDWYSSLEPEDKKKLRCLSGHEAPFLMQVITDRPLHPFCMLRDPVDFVISAFLFAVWRGDHFGRHGPGVSMVRQVREQGGGLKDVYRELGGGRQSSSERSPAADDFLSGFFNWQTRHILLGTVKPGDIPFEADPDALREYRDMAFETLKTSYVVGTQDRFSQSVRLFAATFGWRSVFVPRANVGGLRGREEELGIDDETRSEIRRYNQVDAALHAHYSQRLADLPPTGRLTDLNGRARRHVARARMTFLGRTSRIRRAPLLRRP